ncbi:MAG TPA: porin, partial [Ramlibacter sp.]|nr:porin [Ramlibacter sp.]
MTTRTPKTPACIALALAAVCAHAADNQVYGRLATTVDATNSAADQTAMSDNGSRLGFRGTESLGGGLKALYGVELGFDASSGAMLTPSARMSYVGLRGGFGTLAMGRLYSSNPTGSPIFSQASAIVSFAPNDAGATQIGPSMLNARNRVSNAIGYASPSLGPVVLRARYYLRGAAAAPDDENVANQGRSLDLGLSYAAGRVSAGVSYGRDSRLSGLLANEMKHKWQAGLRYDFGAFEPYVLVGREWYLNTATSRDTLDYWVVGGKLSAGAHAVVLNLLSRDIQTSRTAARQRQQLAYTYALSK